MGVAGLGLVVGFAYLGLAASPRGAVALASAKAFPANFVGWREASAALPPRPESMLLVADNFMLAAELRFAIGPAATVYSLDSPLNVKHGRALIVHPASGRLHIVHDVNERAAMFFAFFKASLKRFRQRS